MFLSCRVTSLICAFEFFNYLNYLIIVLLFRSISFHVALPLYPIGGTLIVPCPVVWGHECTCRALFPVMFPSIFLSCPFLSFPFVSFHFLSFLFIAFDFMSFPLPIFHFHLFFLSISFNFLIIVRFFGCSFPLISSLFSFSDWFPFPQGFGGSQCHVMRSGDTRIYFTGCHNFPW